MAPDLGRVDRFMEQEALDALIATTSGNLLYLCGLWDPSLSRYPWETQDFALVSRDRVDQVVLVLHHGSLDLASHLACVADTVAYGSFARYVAPGVELNMAEELFKTRAVSREPESDAMSALAQALRMSGLHTARIGLDERGFHGDLAQLRGMFPRANIVEASAVFSRIRSVKTPEEVAKLRAAVRLTEESILEPISQVEEGVSEYELARQIKASIVARNATPAFLYLKFGRQGGISQVSLPDTRLSKGDTIWIDIGCRSDGYCSDIARTFAFGEPSARARSIYRSLLAGEDAGLTAIRPGANACAVFDATMKAVREAGISDYRRHHVGHGIGLDTYDLPLLAAEDNTNLEPGMVLDIETPYYEIGTGALHVEDTLLVTAQGAELLTTMTRELRVLE
jgi:Xaa-Pro dipeptidase